MNVECVVLASLSVPRIPETSDNMVAAVILALSAASSALVTCPMNAQRPQQMTGVRCYRTAPVLAQLDDDDELDAMDTVSDWDAELAEMKAWEAAQQKTQPPDVGAFFDSGTGVDEDAHLGLGDDGDV